MVVGEQQIIGQLRTTYQAANEDGTVGRTLHDLTQRALRTGKRVHSETHIDTAGSSMVSFAVDEAVRSLELEGASGELGSEGQGKDATPLAGRRALIIGAGAMASLASTYVGKLGVSEIIVANRTFARAEALAGHAAEAGVTSRAVPLEDMSEVLSQIDLVISATGAVGFVVTAEQMRAAMDERASRSGASPAPVALVDLSMPRDIESSTADIDGVHLLNIEELTTKADDNARDVDPARDIVAEELEAFLEQQRAQAVVPTVKALRKRASDLMAEELQYLDRHVQGMSEEHHAAVEKSMRRLVDRMLHTPTVQAKKLSAGGQSVSYPDALAALFNLPTGIVESVAEPSGVTGGAALKNGQTSSEITGRQARNVSRKDQESTPGEKA